MAERQDAATRSLTLEDIAKDPGKIAANSRLRSGEPVLLRPLDPKDAPALGRYFLGLSEWTVSRYRPHPFDQATADEICRELDIARTMRLVAILQKQTDYEIIAYFILQFGIGNGDRKRYEGYRRPLDPQKDCTLAPSVADAYQDQRLGSVMLKHAIEVARRLDRRAMVLRGGVQARNERAMHFYRKFGFEEVGQFQTQVNNCDMLLDLRLP